MFLGTHATKHTTTRHAHGRIGFALKHAKHLVVLRASVLVGRYFALPEFNFFTLLVGCIHKVVLEGKWLFVPMLLATGVSHITD